MQPRRPPHQLLGEDAAEHFGDAHRALMSLVRPLQGTDDAAEAYAAIGPLSNALRHHFDDEERPDGLFDWLVALLPGSKDRVQVLWQDHERLLVEVRSLAEELAKGPGATDGGVLGRVGEFILHLKEHERRENELMAEALGKD